MKKQGFESKYMNPTFVFSSTDEDRFVLDPRTNPLAGFHLARSVATLTPENDFYCDEAKKTGMGGLAFLLPRKRSL